MPQLIVSCRDFVQDEPCTIAILADNEEDAVEAAVEHAYAAHNAEDTPALREQIRTHARERTGPALRL